MLTFNGMLIAAWPGDGLETGTAGLFFSGSVVGLPNIKQNKDFKLKSRITTSIKVKLRNGRTSEH